jgi:hypothetical protein
VKYTFHGRVVGARELVMSEARHPAHAVEVQFDLRPEIRSWMPYGLNPVDLGTRVTVTIEDES